MKTVISVANQKGGVGKTTTTISLADFLVRLKKRVVLIDLDPQANATSGLGVHTDSKTLTSYNILLSPKNADSSLIKIEDNLSLLPSTTALAAAEIELADKERREYRLADAIEKIEADYILIDCPPSLSLLTVNALAASDYVLVPVQAEYYALEGVTQLINTIQRVRQNLNTKLSLLGIVATMVNARTSLSDQVLGELKKHFGDYLFKTTIPRNVRLAEAPSHGKPIGSYDKWSKGARAYKQLAKEVVDRVEG